MQESKYVDRAVPFSDRQVDYLIKQLRIIEPYLQKVEPDNDAWEHFAAKMEVKFINTPYTGRWMLFDFCKNLIHKKLLMQGGRN